MPREPELQTVAETSLSSYFMERVADHAERLDPPPQEDTCWYLGTLLDRFGRSERLFSWEDGRQTLRPLALLYGDAVEAPDERTRCLILQQLGDMALFVGALFPQRWTRHGIRRDYVVGMGGGAYEYLADNAPRGRHIFEELAGTFTHMLELVAEVCAREAHDDGDVLALYQRWRETGDVVAARRLRAAGLILQQTDEGDATH